MKIVSWNINGIRTVKDLKGMLDQFDADIICFQETKVTRDIIDEPTALVDGYNAYFSFSRNKSGYSGVATYCRESATPLRAEEGLSGYLHTKAEADIVGAYDGIDIEFTRQELKRLDSEGRTVVTQHIIKKEDGSDGKVTIFNVYCPRADPEKPERLEFKLRFYKLLELRACAVKQSGSSVIILGDINTSHRQIDRCENVDQEEFEANPSRQWLNSFLIDGSQNDLENILGDNVSKNFQMIDSFRFFHPHTENVFSCWNTQVNARATNYGSRIDYILVDRFLIQFMIDSLVQSDILGSDHCPVIGTFKIQVSKAAKCPTTCIKNFPEFSGIQQKLSSFFSKKSEGFHGQLSGSKSNDNDASFKRKYSENHSSNIPNNNRSVVKKFKSFDNTTQKRILSFFQKSSDASEEAFDSSSSISSSQGSVSSIVDGPQQNGIMKDEVVSAEKSVAVSAWRSMLTGPRPPPLCKGHKESCVERTVKKKGPNFNRKFYACARGEGSKTDPRARCDHFEWLQKK